MAPVRSGKFAGASTSQASSSKPYNAGKRKTQHKPQREEEGAGGDKLPGVQKIKSSIRQTKRLLAKDKLAADVRVNTERRLKALEAQLAEAELSRKERTIAQRYHKIKFFERQKVTRRIKQVKKQLEEATEKKERKKLEKSLKELRVDLNYITYFPKLKKYISLFPPEVRQGAQDDDTDKGKEKEDEDAEDASGTAAQRDEIRQQIRERMDRGEISAEPELEENRVRGAKSRPTGSATPASKGAQAKHVPEVAEDDFFEGGGDDAEEASGDEGMDES